MTGVPDACENRYKEQFYAKWHRKIVICKKYRKILAVKICGPQVLFVPQHHATGRFSLETSAVCDLQRSLQTVRPAAAKLQTSCKERHAKVDRLVNGLRQSPDLQVRYLEWFLAIAIACSMVIPRLSWLVLLALAGVALAQLIPAINDPRKPKLSRNALLGIAAVGVFLTYALISLFWTGDPTRSAAKLFAIAALYLGALIVVMRVSILPDEATEFLRRGAFFGFAVGLIYYAIEILSGGMLIRQFVSLFGGAPGLVDKMFVEKSTRIANYQLVGFNHNAVSVCLFVWPALVFWSQSKFARHNKLIGLALTAAIVALSLFSSINESAKLALVIGLAVLLIALSHPRITTALLAVTWLASTLLVLPAVEVAYRSELHKNAWVQISGRERIKIWKATYDLYWNHPIFGAGIRAAQNKSDVQPSERTDLPVPANDLRARHYSSHHAHNAFIQIWYELGVIGAVLFTAAGLLIAKALPRQSPATRPYHHALFASVITLIGFSYGFWQTWYQATLLLAIVASVAAGRTNTGTGHQEQST